MKKQIITLMLFAVALSTPLSAQSPSTVTTTKTAEITTTRETWRIQAEVGSTNATVEILRRDRSSVAGVDIGTAPAPTVTRTLATSATDMITLADGTEITLLQLFEAFARFTVQWEAEDNTPPPAEPESSP